MKTAETDDAARNDAPSGVARAHSAEVSPKSAPGAREWFARVRSTLFFLVSWAFIDAMLNVRYPAAEPAFWYLVPTADVVVLFACFALFGWRRVKVPGWAHGVLVFLVLFVRSIRLGDGIQKHYFQQKFHLYTDLPQALELLRFGLSTLGAVKLAGVVLAGLASTGLLAYGAYHALRQAERYLADPRRAAGVFVMSGVVLVVNGEIERAPKFRELYSYGFGKSAFERLSYEATFTANVHGESSAFAQHIAQRQRAIESAPHDLALLRGRNVHLILIESYGETVFARESFARAMKPVVERYERELGELGFGMVSGILDSPTYGGRSWLAHATLGTGVKVDDQFKYEIVCARGPKTLARYFKQAGYRTVLAQPATTRAWPKGEFYGFDRKYYLWDFEYEGPKFSWATMPDEYVLEFLARKELGAPKQPLFIQYTLVSSHAPWSEIPLPLPDPRQIGDGAIYHELPRSRFSVKWPEPDDAAEPYITSILYDFEVIRRFITSYVRDDALVIVLGDHQPVREVTDDAPSRGVPVHVLSRDKALLSPFEARGYVAGMRPELGKAYVGLETFMASFLSDFSQKNP
jgi:hypothetical protein